MAARRTGLRLTHRPIVGDRVHAEGQLLAWVLQQFPTFGEGLGNHLALLDPFGLVITLPSQPEGRKGGDRKWKDEQLYSPSTLLKDQ